MSEHRIAALKMLSQRDTALQLRMPMLALVAVGIKDYIRLHQPVNQREIRYETGMMV